MKTTIIEQNKEEEPFKPALYRDNLGYIALATSKTNGVILHAPTGSWMPVGTELGGQLAWNDAPAWTRITEPATITIRFEP